MRPTSSMISSRPILLSLLMFARVSRQFFPTTKSRARQVNRTTWKIRVSPSLVQIPYNDFENILRFDSINFEIWFASQNLLCVLQQFRVDLPIDHRNQFVSLHFVSVKIDEQFEKLLRIETDHSILRSLNSNLIPFNCQDFLQFDRLTALFRFRCNIL